MDGMRKLSPDEARECVRKQLAARQIFGTMNEITVDEKGIIRLYLGVHFDLGEPNFDWVKDA